MAHEPPGTFANRSRGLIIAVGIDKFNQCAKLLSKLTYSVMNRQKEIRSLLLLLEDFGRVMITKKFEQSQPGMPTGSQMDVLLVIHFSGHLNLKGLAEKLRMTPSGASQLVNSLVNDGFLTRNEDGQDRRTIRLGLTAKAERLLAEERKMRMKQGRLLFVVLNDDELSQFVKIQRKVNDRLHHQSAKN